MDNLVLTVSAMLAPYQPNIPPDYPNTDPRAGQIPSTIVAAGHPIQVKVLERLENHNADVYIYDMPVEKKEPFVNADPLPNGGYEVTRFLKGVCVEIWAETRPQRVAIKNRLNSAMGDVIRQVESDTTVTTLTVTSSGINLDTEQDDSVYICQIMLMADFTITILPGDAGYESALVTETSVGFKVGTVNGSQEVLQ